MDAIFLKLINMSICAGWLILAVIALRLIPAGIPKWTRCVLWALVGVRLLCPFSLESVFSLIPSARTLNPVDVRYGQAPGLDSGIAALDNAVNPVIRESFAPNPGQSVNPLYVLTWIAAFVWLAGVLALAGYAVFSYIRLRQITVEAVMLRENIYLCDHIPTPFISGILHPAIYLPSGLDADARYYVLAHEQAHLLRRDHWWKALGFSLLAVYWFHPLVWAAYVLFCRDIELACDEKAVKDWDFAKKQAYSHALVACSTQQKSMHICPLAFGETGVKKRVKAILRYKKPSLALVAVSAAVCTIVAVCFLANPRSKAQETPPPGEDSTARPDPEDAPLPDEGTAARPDPEDAPRPDEGAAARPDPENAPLPGEDTAARPDPEDAPLPDEGTAARPDPEDAPLPDEGTAAHPDPEDAQPVPAVNTGYPLYDSLIASAARVLAHPREEEYETERSLFTSAYFYAEMTWQTPGYLLMDLDGNGVDELLFGENHDDGWNGIVYNIYTISDGALVRIADGWERNRYYLCENGYIANEGSSGASQSTYCYYTYDKAALTLVEAVVFDASSDPENPWFYTTGDPYAQTAAQTPVSESEAREIMDRYVYVLPQFTPFPDVP